jgi:hypothetical protein
MHRLVIAAAALSPLLADSLSQQDRDQLIGHLERTRKIYMDTIAGVTPQQWTYKASPEQWSIADCAEHLVLTERALFEMVRDKMMKAPAPAEPAAQRVTDATVLQFVTDRSQKAKAPEMLHPKSKYASRDEVAAAFEDVRKTSIEYVRTTNDDLRSRWNKTARGAMDAYQYLLMMAGHVERHSMQMQEVKASPGFPK